MPLAQCFPAADAVSAGAAGITQPGDRDTLIDHSTGDIGAHLHDPANTLATGHERWRGFDRPVPVCGVDVRMAQPAGLDADQHLIRFRRRDGQILDFEGGVETGDDSGLHVMLR